MKLDSLVVVYTRKQHTTVHCQDTAAWAIIKRSTILSAGSTIEVNSFDGCLVLSLPANDSQGLDVLDTMVRVTTGLNLPTVEMAKATKSTDRWLCQFSVDNNGGKAIK
ncbi:hypothetical protein T265_01070 [Opisthorchis viverrini]|uniref:Uncharacterized protein n=1 Tax=Opisthorchis viverrini TaxID=6198 RepID=A0A074ZZT9_OPIVI|nr:hypothetical protein T265_01070 [Opisthorchis viverrini]KER32983.1 hypothetical protein T265_01070 [Opisthorchis viverrini]